LRVGRPEEQTAAALERHPGVLCQYLVHGQGEQRLERGES